MIRELCKHFFQKSLRICRCAGKLTCSGRNEVAFQRIPQGAAIFFFPQPGAKKIPQAPGAVGSHPNTAPTRHVYRPTNK